MSAGGADTSPVAKKRGADHSSGKTSRGADHSSRQKSDEGAENSSNRKRNGGADHSFTKSRRADHSPDRKHRKEDHSPSRRADHSPNGQREVVASPESTLPRARALNASVSPSDDDRRSRKRPSDYTVEDQAKRIKLDSRKRLLSPVGSSSKRARLDSTDSESHSNFEDLDEEGQFKFFDPSLEHEDRDEYRVDVPQFRRMSTFISAKILQRRSAWQCLKSTLNQM